MCIFSDITLCCIFHTSLEWDLIIIEKLQYTCTCYLLKQEDIGNKETGISLEMPLEKCWKWYFQVSRFQNSLREGKVPTPPCPAKESSLSDQIANTLDVCLYSHPLFLINFLIQNFMASSGGSLRTGHQANWAAARRIFPTWFDHLAEMFFN